MSRHDALWKELLKAFFPEFMDLVVPVVAVQLKTGERKFLEQESYSDLAEGSHAQMDLVAEVPALFGETQIVLTHIEVERDFGQPMDKRTFRYFLHLKLKHDAPVLPIVLFLRGGEGGVTKRTYLDIVAGQVVNRFTYWALGLSAAKAEEFLGTSALGAALASCTRGDRLRPYEKKYKCLEAILDSGVDEARQFLLLDAVETYLELDKTNALKYQELVSESPRKQEVVDMELTWAGKIQERARREGIELGKQEGVKLGRQEGVKLGRQEGVKLGRREGVEMGRVEMGRRLLTRLLSKRFGALSPTVSQRIDALSDIAEIESLSDQVFDSESLDDLGLEDQT